MTQLEPTRLMEIFAAHRQRIDAMTDAEYREWKAARARRHALAQAFADLGATEVAPGYYALKGAHTGRWRVLSAAKVAPGYRPTVLHFVVSGFKMPSWWSPQRREVWANINPDGSLGELRAFHDRCLPNFRRITVDLETGAEIRV